MEKKSWNAICIQKYTTSAISTTLNLPKSTTKETISNIYLESWKKGLKGQTVYVDGSRSGVLVSTTENKGRDEFNYVDAVKRPKELPAEVHTTKVGGKSYNVFVGLLNNKPYEVFIEEIINGVGIGNSYLKGVIKKKSKGVYNYSSYDEKGGLNIGISSGMTNEQSVITRLVSTSLRHGADIKFIVEQINNLTRCILMRYKINCFAFTMLTVVAWANTTIHRHRPKTAIYNNWYV